MSGTTLTYSNAFFIGLCLEGFFYGLYSGIFALYIQYQLSEKCSHKMNNILFYTICVLYVLSAATHVIDTIGDFYVFGINSIRFDYVQCTISGFCDFISQSILIYRCWIVWGYNTRVIIIPSILAFVYIVTWLAVNGAVYIFQGVTITINWGNVVTVTSLIVSLSVNAVVTGLIVLRIFKVYQQVKHAFVNKDLNIGTGGRKLRSIMFVIIESGMTLFVVQVIRVVFSILQTELQVAEIGFNLIIGIHQMLNGLTPTIILVRVSMGLSFHDEESMVEVATNLCLASDNPNPNLEMDNERPETSLT